MRYFGAFLMLFLCLTAFGQSLPKKQLLTARGYVKDLHSVSFTGSDSMIQDNFIHNRLNFRLQPSNNLSFGLELRNRFFYGEAKKNNPFYTQILDNDQGLVDLSFNLYEDKAVLFLTAIDRLWLNYSDEKWNIRMGRQRINWGLNMVWNPNDLFNVFNFSDFDYEERPGADAIRIERYLKGGMNSMEFTYSPSRFSADHVAAFKYRMNVKGYDLQFLGGLYHRDIALGLGWAGNIKTGGFKGELSYFHDSRKLNAIGQFASSITYDISFKSSSYLALSMLHNSAGSDSLFSTNNSLFIGSQLSPKNLMPNKFSYFAQYSYQFSPIFTGGIASIYAQGIDFLFLMPNIAYSISNTWDISLIMQLFYGEKGSGYGSLGNTVFLRTRWSF